jgi:enamine deaminase RidA (YjgF/YER057c/UK114 family)
MNQLHNIGVADQVGAYGDAVETAAGARWLHTSGTPGIGANGCVPEGITAQAEQAWAHIVTMLARAGMDLGDVVKMTHYLTREADIPAYAAVRAQVMGDLRPASMLAVLPALVRPEFLVEVEVAAARR